MGIRIDVRDNLAFFIGLNKDRRERYFGLTKLRGWWELNLYLVYISCSHPWGKR